AGLKRNQRRGVQRRPPEQARETGNGGLAEEGRHRKLCAQLPADRSDESHRHQGVPSRQEKVLLDVVASAAEDVRPEGRDSALEVVARSQGLATSGRALGRGKSAAVDLP